MRAKGATQDAGKYTHVHAHFKKEGRKEGRKGGINMQGKLKSHYFSTCRPRKSKGRSKSRCRF